MTEYPAGLKKVGISARLRTRIAEIFCSSYTEIRTMPARSDGESLDDFGLFAIIGTWMESDVVEATVLNAFAQGVERVFIIDNDSPDDTVATAVKSGATPLINFQTSAYDEMLRIDLIRAAMQHISSTSGMEYVWWLLLDADEFPRPVCEGTIKHYLSTIDRRCRVVGARFINHYPTPGEIANISGRHPIDFQPLCEEMESTMCRARHRKHPLIRWDRRGPRIDTTAGFHRVSCSERTVLEPAQPIAVHHFPFRNEPDTRMRLESLFGDGRGGRVVGGDVAIGHMEARRKSLDAVYQGRWEEVETLSNEEKVMGVAPVHWQDLVPGLSRDIVRWY